MILILIPAYNEEAALGGLLDSLPVRVDGCDIHTIVLDDGSTDATSEVALNAGVEVTRFEENRGKGAVLKSAFDAIDGASLDAVVLMDADGQHDPDRLETLLGPVLDGSCDLVVGSRYVGGGGRGATPRNRYFVRFVVRWVLKFVLGADVTDPFSGYRVLSPHALESVHLCGDRYESELEMLFCAQRNALRMCEVPVPKIYGPATSKMGNRYGAVLGRIDVVSRYALTIAREAIGSYSAPARWPRTWRVHERAD